MTRLFRRQARRQCACCRMVAVCGTTVSIDATRVEFNLGN